MRLVLSIAFIALSFFAHAQNRELHHAKASIVIDSCAGPLFIVDGIRKTELKMNLNTIEKMEILKKEIAVALYGESARNGVIIVTTENGPLTNPMNKTEFISH